MAEEAITSKEYFALDSFHWHFISWYLMGLDASYHSKKTTKILYQLYSITIIFLVNVYFPFSLLYGLLQQTSLQVILENTAMCLTIIVGAFKAFDTFGKIQTIRELGEISKDFEKKAKQQADQYALILKYKASCRKFVNGYLIASAILITFAALSVLTFDTRKLLHAAGYFPYDYTTSRTVYVITAIYQIFAWASHVLANIFYDTYPGMLYFLLSQHVQILNLRISQIGYDPGLTHEQHHELLRTAIQDHNRIIAFYKTTQEVVSPITLVLFVSTSLNIVTCVVSFTFFAETAFQKGYLLQLSICYAMETVLGCYYGSEYEAQIYKVTGALYSCKWYNQTKSFKKDLTIFMECSLRNYRFEAGGLIPVSKMTFIQILRGVFSLYTVMENMREKI